MKPNIFLIDPRLGAEDALTAYWHYLLSVVPGLGQRFVDAVCEASGLGPTAFIGAIDHPYGDSANHPDLLLQCRDWSLLFEHKLDSPVGPRQLHRYLDLAQSRGWKFALMTANRIQVPEDVLGSLGFVKPLGGDRPAHFLWQDLHPILRAANHHLTTEFAEFLELNGLGKFSWAGLGDPFTDKEAAESLVGLYQAVGERFRREGALCRPSANSLIYQIRTPFAPIHLINIGPLQSVAQEVPALRGPVMGVWVWVQRSIPDQRLLSMSTTPTTLDNSALTVTDHERTIGLRYDGRIHCERSYYIPLDQILPDTLPASGERLTEFVERAVHHLRQELNTVSDKALQPTSRAQRPGRSKGSARAARG